MANFAVGDKIRFDARRRSSTARSIGINLDQIYIVSSVEAYGELCLIRLQGITDEVFDADWFVKI